ncbi:sigma-70 family RNA polymerase sigma factor [Actinoplanes sichuanensis]|uniref:RNA polymerase sigma factor n=1 Tax=Actinoplanes sichuanensis TaxID=512349 RepID=A0ABW4AT33_9ACTN|nr:RNA polymerase sigma factor [Actinoplanes sichuanensis]BEL01945.1 sigma-70 family RNA polymerase sigma factor [Actinoplanes sichuanensis]
METELLVRAAQRGDAASLTVLFQAHYVGMRSVALQILGSGPDVDDVCQEAAITALTRIGQLRDPSAVRFWLHAIVRNLCRTRLREARPVPMDLTDLDLPLAVDDPVQRYADRDWVRHALTRLSPVLRPVTMLRYFAERNSYERIAGLCVIPVGTVRSRLSEARRQLSQILPSVRDERHDESAALTTLRRAEAAAILGGSPGAVRGRWAHGAVVCWPDGRRTTGLSSVSEALRRDVLPQRLVDVVAAPDVTVWETTSGTWLLHERGGQVRNVRLAVDV